MTTEATDSNATTPPTNLTSFDQGCGEADLRWTPLQLYRLAQDRQEQLDRILHVAIVHHL